jgi:N-acetylmuramoyl-L-alanine amidase
MAKLIALCDGHGMDTSGKRTPIFPSGSGMVSETGSFMHENEFNRAVVKYLKEELERCGFQILLVAPTDADTPLRERTNLANRMKADMYVSVHANAIRGAWNGARGIETFYYPNSATGKRLATIVHKYLTKGTRQLDRGVRSQNFHVLRETNMPSVLVECGFMDNLEEAKLLLSDDFRRECAKEIAQGVCEYFGVNYVEKPVQAVSGISDDNNVYWDGSPMKKGQIGRITILKPINLWKRDENDKLTMVKVLNPPEQYRVYGFDDKHGGQYNVGGGCWVTNMDGFVKYETPSKSKLEELNKL